MEAIQRPRSAVTTTAVLCPGVGFCLSRVGCRVVGAFSQTSSTFTNATGTIGTRRSGQQGDALCRVSYQAPGRAALPGRYLALESACPLVRTIAEVLSERSRLASQATPGARLGAGPANIAVKGGSSRPIIGGRVVAVPTAGIGVDWPYRAFIFGLVIGHCRHWGRLGSTSAMWRTADGGGITQPEVRFLCQRTHTFDPKLSHRSS